MSGIAGIVHFRGPPPARDQAHQLSAGVAHRGPDAREVFADGPVVLTYRRFSTWRRRSSQPAVSDRYALVVDGRLYQGDAGRLLAQWTEQGPGCLPRVEADFALAVWDRLRKVLWLCRDACGTRPMFWSTSSGRVAFCSEIPPLLRLPWVSRDLAVDNLAEYLSFRYVHAPRTLLQDVSALPPGHLVRIDASGARLERWWHPPWAPPGEAVPSDQEVAQRTDQLLRKSVERRLQGEAQVGLLLSGGLDSSAILHHAIQLNRELPTFTVALSEDDADESPFAARVARVMGAPPHLIRVSDRQFIDALTAATEAMGQPMPTAAGAVQHLLFAEVRRSVRVLLSGDGGDEVLGGRGMDHIAARLRKARLVSRLPSPARRTARALARRAKRNDWSASATHFGMDRAIGGSRVFHSAERVDLLADPGMVRPGIRRTALEPIYQEVDSTPINNILHVWQRGWLPEDSLARSDRMSMHNGLEVRYPMLDAALVTWLATLPGGIKVRHRRGHYITKWPLRLAMEKRLPRRLINRPKRSLPNPLHVWLRAPGADFLSSQVDALCTDSSDLFVPAVVRRMANEHRSGHANHGLRLWTLILFQMWRQGLG